MICFGESCVVENESNLSSATGEISQDAQICRELYSDWRTKKAVDTTIHGLTRFSIFPAIQTFPQRDFPGVTAHLRSRTRFASPFCHR